MFWARMHASSLILFHSVHHPEPCGVGYGGCDCADGFFDDHTDGAHDRDDDEDVSSSGSLSVGDQPLAHRTLLVVHCTPHRARQEKQ